MADSPRWTINGSRICLFIAFVFFLLATFGVKPIPVDMVAAGLAFFAAAGLIP